ncbi:MAG: hypothetical protein V5A56_03280 [Halolamina sp.]
MQAGSGRLKQRDVSLLANAVEHGQPDDHHGKLESGFFFPPIQNPRRRPNAMFDADDTTMKEAIGDGGFIVTRVLDAHGWDVRVTERSTGGVRFEFTGHSVEWACLGRR